MHRLSTAAVGQEKEGHGCLIKLYVGKQEGKGED